MAKAALAVTFATRGTHPLPSELRPPPASWEADFTGMAEETNISTGDYLEAFAILNRFWTEHRLGAGE
jgi:hypothetical protein